MDRSKTIHALKEGPLILSIAATIHREDDTKKFWVNSVAEEICAYVNNLRAVATKSIEPKPFLTDVTFPPLMFQECPAPAPIQVSEHPIYDPSTFREFMKLVCAVFPASLVHVPDVTHTLYLAGYPFEYVFVRMVLYASLDLASAASKMHTIYCTEGILSIWWLRMFLASLSHVQLDDSGNTLEDFVALTDPGKFSTDLIQSSASIPVTTEWVQEWATYETLSS